MVMRLAALSLAQERYHRRSGALERLIDLFFAGAMIARDGSDAI
jgi:hypothetical protein